MENKFDLTHLRQLVGGDEAMVHRFLDLFKTEMPKQLAVLERQLKAGDFASANVTAHGIKGQLRTLGLEELAELALHIENKTEKESDAQELTLDFNALKSHLQAIL